MGTSSFDRLDAPLVWLDTMEQSVFSVMGTSASEVDSLPTLTLSTKIAKALHRSNNVRCSALAPLDDFHVTSAGSNFVQLWNLPHKRFRFWDRAGNAAGGNLKRFAFGQAFSHPGISVGGDETTSITAVQLTVKDEGSSAIVAGTGSGVLVVW